MHRTSFIADSIALRALLIYLIFPLKLEQTQKTSWV